MTSEVFLRIFFCRDPFCPCSADSPLCTRSEAWDQEGSSDARAHTVNYLLKEALVLSFYPLFNTLVGRLSILVFLIGLVGVVAPGPPELARHRVLCTVQSCRDLSHGVALAAHLLCASQIKCCPTRDACAGGGSDARPSGRCVRVVVAGAGGVHSVKLFDLEMCRRLLIVHECAGVDGLEFVDETAGGGNRISWGWSLILRRRSVWVITESAAEREAAHGGLIASNVFVHVAWLCTFSISDEAGFIGIYGTNRVKMKRLNPEPLGTLKVQFIPVFCGSRKLRNEAIIVWSHLVHPANAVSAEGTSCIRHVVRLV